MNCKLPNILGIGVQKGGTTWLYHQFKMHRDIFVPDQKEQHFFDNKLLSNENVEKYKKVFEGALSDAVAEVTPGYFWVSDYKSDEYGIDRKRFDTPKRVSNLLGSDVRLILLLRNPTDRAISAYLHHLKRGRISRSDSILDVGRKYGIIHMGFYAEHLKRWLDFFPLENIFIGKYESLGVNLLHDISSFIGVRDFEDKSHQVDRRYNVNYNYENSEDGVILDGQVLISPKERQCLNDIYEPENYKLNTLLGRSLY